MCLDREHRFRMNVKVNSETPFDLVINAKGMTEALAKADGYIVTHYGPDASVTITTWRMGYGTTEAAIEHGAIL